MSSQFFRIIIGVQSGPDTFHESRFVMMFLTILGVTEICSFSLVLEGKTGKEIPKSLRLEFLEKFLANSVALSDAEDNTSRLLTVLAICQKSQEPTFWEVMDSDVLLACASLAASRTLLQQLLVCLNFTLDLEDLFCWYKKKKRFL